MAWLLGRFSSSADGGGETTSMLSQSVPGHDFRSYIEKMGSWAWFDLNGVNEFEFWVVVSDVINPRVPGPSPQVRWAQLPLNHPPQARWKEK